MTRASRPCSIPGCWQLAPCPTHPKPAPWANSTRRERVGKSGWQQQRDAKRIITRHRGICHVCGKPGATIADHVIPMAEGGTDSDTNKRPIHAKPCHEAKTKAEAARARWG